jgi:hypothetical protein
MTTAIVTGLIVFLFVALFLFIGKRVLRLAVQLLLAGVVIFVLLAITAVCWWRGWFSSAVIWKTQRPATSGRSNSR